MATASLRKQEILDAGEVLFKKYGISRVTVREICQKAGTSKMTFYKYFPDKIELAKAVIDKEFVEAIEKFKTYADQDIPFTQKVQYLLDQKIAFIQDAGQEWLDEIMRGDVPALADFLKKKVEEKLSLATEFYGKAKKRGDIRPDIKLEFILYFINHLADLLADERLTKLYDSREVLVTELVNFFFYGVLPRK